MKGSDSGFFTSIRFFETPAFEACAETMDTPSNPYQSPVDAEVVDTSPLCPSCGQSMQAGLVRTNSLRWDDGSRPWWSVFLWGYETLIPRKFIEIWPHRIPSHRCRACDCVLMNLQRRKR